MLPSIRLFERSPVLSPSFESSLPGLFFAGVSAKDSFGPVLRFAFGARFTAERLAARLLRIAFAGSPAGRAAEANGRLAAGLAGGS
jgi:hypothetical protein